MVDARGGPSLKLTSRPKKIKSISKKARPSQISRLQKELKRNSEFWSLTLMMLITLDHHFKTLLLCLDSDAHSTTSSASPAQSPSYSHLSDDGSDTELSPGSSRSPVFSFLDLTYWKRYLLIYVWELQRAVQLVCGNCDNKVAENIVLRLLHCYIQVKSRVTG